MKKRNTIILVIMIIVQCFFGFCVSAQKNFEWETVMHGAAETETTKYIATIMDRYKYSGEKAISIECLVGSKNEENYIELKTSLTQPLGPGRYVLTFHSKGSPSATTVVTVGDMEFTYADFTKTAVEAPSGDTGWSEYTKTFDYVGSEVEYISFRFYSRIAGELLDDISLTDQNINYIPNPGFEPDGEVTPDVGDGESGDEPEQPQDSEYTTNEYQPIGVLASYVSGKIILNWRNPATSELNKIEVYDITNDEKGVLLTDSIQATPSKITYYQVENLDNDVNYKFKLIFHFSSHDAITYYVNGTPSNNMRGSLGSWLFIHYPNGAAKYCPAEGELDFEVAHGGSVSYKVTSNIDKTLDEFKSNIHFDIQKELELQPGKRYKLSLWVKSQEVSDKLFIHMNYAKFDGYKDNELSYSDFKGTQDWKYKEFTFTATNTLFVIGVDFAAEAIWFDDIECYEIDEDGNPVTGENIVSEGGFEGLASEDVGAISEISAVSEDDFTTLKWEKPVAKYAGSYIYEKVNDKYECRGEIGSDISSLKLYGLKNDTEYSFRLVPYNSNGFKGEPIDVTFRTNLPEYEIGEIVLKKGESIETELVGAGEYLLAVDVKNNTIDSGMEYEQLVMVYKGKTLEKIYSSDKRIIDVSEVNGPAENVVTPFIIPEGDDYSIGILIINSRDKMDWFKRPLIIK